jgi:Na+/proline symporter
MLIFSIVILLMEKLGGMHSVVLTDAVQSTIMIATFIAVPVVLGFDFGFLPSISPADCSSFTLVSTNATGVDGLPRTCALADDAGCRASGCIGDVRPEFFDYPDRANQADVFFFMLNMVAAPLQPHMLQRAYIARSDRTLRVVMVAMLVAPFLAQTPGILMGLTKAAFEPSWSSSSQQATAFASISDQLITRGPFQYFLAVVMTGSAMSAIMSTADSVILGASNIVSIDIYKGLFNPSASTDMIVRVAGLNSLVMAAIAFVLALNLSVGKMGAMIVFQNGMLMQIIPAYGMGLFFGISERAATGGIVAGLVSLVSLVIMGNPLAPYVPLVNVSVFVNFSVVFGLQSSLFFCQVATGGVAAEEAQSRFGDQLHPDAIAKVMGTSTEPNRVLLASMFATLLLSVPWYGQPDMPAAIYAGVPLWGVVQVIAYVAVLLMGFFAAANWRIMQVHEGEVKEQASKVVDPLPTIMQVAPSKVGAEAIEKSESFKTDESSAVSW